MATSLTGWWGVALQVPLLAVVAALTQMDLAGVLRRRVHRQRP
ncbi:MAG TPA: hypothetical protein VHA57_01685 [Actinomycetota bacterium]|nr:hypothetical protein [Actinomycetota bacterium]